MAAEPRPHHRSESFYSRGQQHWLVGQQSSSYPLPMSQASHAALLEGALKLPPDDRLALATELLHSVEGPDDPEWAQAWSAEIARRIQELDEGKVETIPWPELRAQLRARFAFK